MGGPGFNSFWGSVSPGGEPPWVDVSYGCSRGTTSLLWGVFTCGVVCGVGVVAIISLYGRTGEKRDLVCGVLDGRRLGDAMAGVIVRTPFITGGTRPNRFVVLHISGSKREIPLAVTSFGERGRAMAVVFRIINTRAAHLGGGGTNSCVRSFINPLNGPAGARNCGGITIINNNMNATVTCPITGGFTTYNTAIRSVINFEGGSLIVLRGRFRSISSGCILIDSSNSANAGNFMASTLGSLVSSNRGCSLIVTVNPVPVVGFISGLAGRCKVGAVISVGPVVVSNAKVYKKYELAINNRAGFTYISNPRFSNRLISCSRTVRHNSVCGGFRHRRRYGLLGRRIRR